MIDISRHRELIDTEKFNDQVHIIGVGATGSFVAYALAKLGIKTINVYDFDVVEEHNVANQLFSINDIGKLKVDALAEIIKRDTGIEIKTNNVRVTNQTMNGYVYVMVDSMASRKEIFNNVVKFKPYIKLAVEPRMGLDMCRIYNINPIDMDILKFYESTLYKDEEAEVSACGSTMSVITSSLFVASYVVRQLINHVNEVELNKEILVDMKFNNMITY